MRFKKSAKLNVEHSELHRMVSIGLNELMRQNVYATSSDERAVVTRVTVGPLGAEITFGPPAKKQEAAK